MGASYCTEGNGSASSHGGPAGDAYTCGPWSDKSTAKANHHAHLSFFRDAFPEFEASQQPVSLVGESYAGVYVPLFANEWLDDPIKGPKGKLINFKGIAVGDGFPACIPQPGKPIDWCVNLVEVEFFRYPNALPGPYWDVEFFHGHSQMSEDLYQRIVTEGGCSDDELRGKQAPLAPGAKCLALLSEMSAEVGFFYAYNLFEACPDEVPNKTSTVAAASTEPGLPKASRRMTSGSVRPRSLTTPRHGTGATAAVAISAAGDATSTAAASTTAAAPPPLYSIVPSPGDGDTGLGAPCLGSAMKTYFGLPTVTQALGIPDNNRFIVLDNGIGMNYTTDSAFVGYVYEKLVKAGKTVLVYEGDSDDCGLQTAPVEDIWAPFFGNGTRRPDQWTPAGPLNTPTSMPLRLPLTHPWRPFGVLPAGRKVQGGFSMSWNHGQVTFVSVRGAGHLLPLYRPAASYTMMHSYQTGEALPPTFWP
jgi:serine carboxypeptidase-like clade 1